MEKWKLPEIYLCTYPECLPRSIPFFIYQTLSPAEVSGAKKSFGLLSSSVDNISKFTIKWETFHKIVETIRRESPWDDIKETPGIKKTHCIVHKEDGIHMFRTSLMKEEWEL